MPDGDHNFFACILRATSDRLADFRRNDRAGVTIEFVLWIPVFLVVLALTVDVSMLFLRQANIWNVTRDAARQGALHRLRTVDEIEDYAEKLASFDGDAATATAVITTTDVMLQVTVPISDVGIFGILQIGAGQNLVANVMQRREQRHQ